MGDWQQAATYITEKIFINSFNVQHVQASKAQNQNKMENTKQDLAAITLALDNYLDGIYTGDIKKLVKVYDAHALVLGDVNGVPYFKTLDQYLDGVKNRQSVKDSGKPFNGTIISIDVINSIAVVKLHVKMYDFNYHEFLSFHKLDKQWLIVNKMLTNVI